MQIYVPWNVVLVHEGRCHFKAQWGKDGMLQCAKDVMHFYKLDVIKEWLGKIESQLTIASERSNWIEEHGRMLNAYSITRSAYRQLDRRDA
jgi:hypothetical protein